MSARHSMLAIFISRACHHRARGTCRDVKHAEREFSRVKSLRVRAFSRTHAHARTAWRLDRFAARTLERARKTRNDHLSDSHGARNISAGSEGRDVLECGPTATYRPGVGQSVGPSRDDRPRTPGHGALTESVSGEATDRPIQPHRSESR